MFQTSSGNWTRALSSDRTRIFWTTTWTTSLTPGLEDSTGTEDGNPPNSQSTYGAVIQAFNRIFLKPTILQKPFIGPSPHCSAFITHLYRNLWKHYSSGTLLWNSYGI